MYICIYVNKYLYIYVYICICTHVYVFGVSGDWNFVFVCLCSSVTYIHWKSDSSCAYVCIYICIYVPMYVYICMYVWIYEHMYIFIYVCLCICKSVYIVCMHIYNVNNIWIFVDIYISMYVYTQICWYMQISIVQVRHAIYIYIPHAKVWHRVTRVKYHNCDTFVKNLIHKCDTPLNLIGIQVLEVGTHLWMRDFFGYFFAMFWNYRYWNWCCAILLCQTDEWDISHICHTYGFSHMWALPYCRYWNWGSAILEFD